MGENSIDGLAIRELSVSYWHRRKGQNQVLNKLNLTIGEGAFVVVVGPSGCGKTSMLLAIAGLLDVAGAKKGNGSIFYRGLSPIDLRNRSLVGFAFQNPTLLPWLTVEENLVLPRKLGKISANKIPIKDLNEIISITGLDNYRHYLPKALSGGLAQRVNLARALICQPEILLLDEPVSHIDYFTRRQLLLLIRQIHVEKSLTTIMTTHDLREAALVADQVLCMRQLERTEFLAIDLRDSLGDSASKKNLLDEKTAAENELQIVRLLRKAHQST